MKIALTFLLSLAVYNSLGQIEIRYTFRDVCNDSFVTVNYELFRFSDSKNFQSDGKDAMLDSTGVYLFSFVIRRNHENLLFSTDKFYKRGKSYVDTILIPKLLPRQNALHENNRDFYFCGLKASGIVKDFYPNGAIRMEGTFLNGIPISDIRFYNINGELVKKEIYKSGKYIDSKFYHNKDKSDSY